MAYSTHEERATAAMTLPSGRLLSISDYAELGEDDRSRWELQEGNLIMLPSPAPRRMVAAAELYVQLRHQLPAEFRAVPDVDIDVQLAGLSSHGHGCQTTRVCRRGHFPLLDR